MKIHSELAKGLFLIEKSLMIDERGSFQRVFCTEELKEIWGERNVYQANRSITKEVGAFRGLHYQKPPFCEMKFIQCLHGKVLDIAVDLRADSATFLQSFSFELSSENNMCIVIPEGFAHGFQVLEKNSELLYFHSSPYKKDYEGGVNYLDPRLKIKLPFPAKEISIRDQSFSNLSSNFEGIKL